MQRAAPNGLSVDRPVPPPSTIRREFEVPANPTPIKRPSSAKAAFAHLKREAGKTFSMLAALFASAVLWFLVLTGCGALLLVAGIFVLAGLGWSLIAGGALCVMAASFVRKGIAGG